MRRKETVEPGGGRFTYTYYYAGRITLIKNPQDDLTTNQYDDANRRTAILRQNGNRTSLIYHDANQIKEMLHRNSGGTILTAFTYTYDDAGARTSTRSKPGPVTHIWAYDNAYRLTA